MNIVQLECSTQLHSETIKSLKFISNTPSGGSPVSFLEEDYFCRSVNSGAKLNSFHWLNLITLKGAEYVYVHCLFFIQLEKILGALMPEFARAKIVSPSEIFEFIIVTQRWLDRKIYFWEERKMAFSKNLQIFCQYISEHFLNWQWFWKVKFQNSNHLRNVCKNHDWLYYFEGRKGFLTLNWLKFSSNLLH